MEEVSQIPIGRVTPHPQLSTRLRLDIRSLAVLIREAADEDVPNGQLEPGRVVPTEDGKGFYVYIGVRRFRALESLYKETGDRRFSVFNAYVDSNGSLLDLFLRVRSENEDRNGERVGLSTLEKIFGLHKISASLPPERLDVEMRRELAVAERLDEKRIMRLFEVETATRFRFQLDHLERLCEIRDEREMFESAACVAGLALPPERVEGAVKGRDSAGIFGWFGSVFPEFAKTKGNRPGAAKVVGGEERQAAGTAGRQGGQTSEPPRLEVHKTDVVLAPCPKCGAENMLQVRLDAEVRILPRDPDAAGETVAADAVVGCPVKCAWCQTDFRVFVKPLGGRRFAAEASLSNRFREPQQEQDAAELRFDRATSAWQKIEDGKVVGLVRTRGRAEGVRV